MGAKMYGPWKRFVPVTTSKALTEIERHRLTKIQVIGTISVAVVRKIAHRAFAVASSPMIWA